MPAMKQPLFHLAGDSALLASWPDSPQGNALARALKSAVETQGLPEVLECVPALQSLLVRFDPLKTDPERLEDALGRLCGSLADAQECNGREIEIPFCADPELAPDLKHLAKSLNIEAREVIALFSAATHRAMFLGFLPGFAYLTGLPERLRVPRLATPRARVPQGSVAIADGMSAVYPLESPGGWHLIGRTPLKPLDPTSSEPFLIRPGDLVRFVPIAKSLFERLSA
jgi:KipI family sensor histidine kinase inhibitor